MPIGADHHKRVVNFVCGEQFAIHQHNRAHRFAPPGHPVLLTVSATLQFDIIVTPAQRGLLIVARLRLICPGHVPAQSAIRGHRVVVVHALRAARIRRIFERHGGAVAFTKRDL
ncbi:hypothetical protein D3C80_1179080 [compost metagenome]